MAEKIEHIDEVNIERLKITDIFKVLDMYNDSSTELKKYFPAPLPIANKIWFLITCFSATPFREIFPWKVYAFVAKKRNKIVGFAFIVKSKRKKELGIMVKEGYQNQGIGDKLLEQTLKGQKNVTLKVFAANKGAIKLYKKHGFVFVKKEEIEYMHKI